MGSRKDRFRFAAGPAGIKASAIYSDTPPYVRSDANANANANAEAESVDFEAILATLTAGFQQQISSLQSGFADSIAQFKAESAANMEQLRSEQAANEKRRRQELALLARRKRQTTRPAEGGRRAGLGFDGGSSVTGSLLGVGAGKTLLGV